MSLLLFLHILLKIKSMQQSLLLKWQDSKKIHIITEPTAAAYVYSINNDLKTGTILVFDLRGGTLDPSIIEVDNRHFVTKAIFGDTCLGGEDFTNELKDHFARKYEQETEEKLDVDNMLYLREACETAKKMLSSSDRTEIYIKGREYTITIEEFESICHNLFLKIEKCISEAFEEIESNIKKSLDKILLIGGSSRMTRLGTLLKNYFKDIPLCYDVNPDEAVAQGAAICAAYHNNHFGFEDFLAEEVIPHAIGVENSKGKLVRILKKNDRMPSKNKHLFTTSVDYVTAIDFHIYEGDDEIAEKNVRLGMISLDIQNPAEKGKPSFEVEFSITIDGILKVSALDNESKLYKEIIIQRKY